MPPSNPNSKIPQTPAGWPDNSPGSAPALRSASDEGGKNECNLGTKPKKGHSLHAPIPRDLINTLLQQGAHHPHGTFPLLRKRRRGPRERRFLPGHSACRIWNGAPSLIALIACIVTAVDGKKHRAAYRSSEGRAARAGLPMLPRQMTTTSG
jgi:hypothetical protein